jgi:hypothetical protein
VRIAVPTLSAATVTCVEVPLAAPIAISGALLDTLMILHSLYYLGQVDYVQDTYTLKTNKKLF